jgi:hypothetical protein
LQQQLYSNQAEQDKLAAEAAANAGKIRVSESDAQLRSLTSKLAAAKEEVAAKLAEIAQVLSRSLYT